MGFKEDASVLSKPIFSAFSDEAKTKVSAPKVYYSNGLKVAPNLIDGNPLHT